MPTLKSLVLEPFLENKECTHLGVTQMCQFLNNGVVVWASQVALVEKHSPASAGDLSNVGSIPGWGRCPRRRPWCPLQWALLTCSAEDSSGPLCKPPELAFWPPSPPWHSALPKLSTQRDFQALPRSAVLEVQPANSLPHFPLRQGSLSCGACHPGSNSCSVLCFVQFCRCLR